MWSVWCESLGGWCGPSSRHNLETGPRPFRSMTSSDRLAAAARCRSLAGEFPFECFTGRKIEEGGGK